MPVPSLLCLISLLTATCIPAFADGPPPAAPAPNVVVVEPGHWLWTGSAYAWIPEHVVSVACAAVVAAPVTTVVVAQPAPVVVVERPSCTGALVVAPIAFGLGFFLGHGHCESHGHGYFGPRYCR